MTPATISQNQHISEMYLAKNVDSGDSLWWCHGKWRKKVKAFLANEDSVEARLLKKGWEIRENDGGYIHTATGSVADTLAEAGRQQNLIEAQAEADLKRKMEEHLTASGWEKYGINETRKITSIKRGKKTYKTTISTDVWRRKHWDRDVKEGECEFYHANLNKAYAQQLKIDEKERTLGPAPEIIEDE